MLRKIFDDGVEELIKTFPDLRMTDDRAEVWYKYSKHLSDADWETRIDACIRNCTKKEPLLADILDERGYYQRKEVDYKKYEG
ncbi:hypothetical protein ES705_15224 [subsurface metagenome]